MSLMTRIIIAAWQTGFLLALLLPILFGCSPAHALPVEIQGLAWLNAPPCGWEGQRLDVLIAAGPITPPCSRGLQINVLASLNGTEASDFYFTSIHDPGRGHANTLIHQEVRPNTMAGRVQNVSLEDLPDGRNEVRVSLGPTLHIYGFTLIRGPEPPWDEPEPPVAATPEPATLILLGVTAAVGGWVARRRRQP